MTQLTSSHGLSHIGSAKLIGMLDVGLVMAVHSRKRKGQKTAPTIEQAADAFLRTIPAKFEANVELPWKKSALDVAATSDTLASKALNTPTYAARSPETTLVDALTLGFVIA